MSDFAPAALSVPRLATCQPDHCFCEAQQAGWPRQPANALSSLTFLLVAAAVWRRGRFAADRVFVLAALFVGLGSLAFHATLTFATQTADVLGMYLVVTWLLLWIVADRRRWSGRTVAGGYALGNALLLAGLIAWPTMRREVFAGLVLATVSLASPPQRRALLPALAVFAVSFGVWTLDLLRWWCTPDSLIQGHALWHLGSAIAMWLAWSALTTSAQRNRGALVRN